MKETRKQQLRDIMLQAWRICKVTGETFAECLKKKLDDCPAEKGNEERHGQVKTIEL